MNIKKFTPNSKTHFADRTATSRTIATSRTAFSPKSPQNQKCYIFVIPAKASFCVQSDAVAEEMKIPALLLAVQAKIRRFFIGLDFKRHARSNRKRGSRPIALPLPLARQHHRQHPADNPHDLHRGRPERILPDRHHPHRRRPLGGRKCNGFYLALKIRIHLKHPSLHTLIY